LGYKITESGVRPDPQKVAAVLTVFHTHYPATAENFLWHD
jgi:hypothetical protein